MAQKKKEEAKATSKKETSKKGAVDTAAEEKAAKRAARLAKLKERPAGQRPNSKQVDIIDLGNGTVKTFGYAVRKTGTLVTAILFDTKGNPISVSTTLVPGTKVKVKKEHGILQPGVSGVKKGAAEEEDED